MIWTVWKTKCSFTYFYCFTGYLCGKM